MSKMFLPCHENECNEIIGYDSEDSYVRKYCEYHYNDVKNELIKMGADPEELMSGLLWVLK